MLRIILGVIAGFIVWSIVWLGTDVILATLSPDWYGKYITDFQNAAAAGQPFKTENSKTIMALILSIICSIASGFATVAVAGENTKTPLILGIILLAVGLLVEISFWTYLPLWYHLTFLILLIPMTILGGKLKKA